MFDYARAKALIRVYGCYMTRKQTDFNTTLVTFYHKNGRRQFLDSTRSILEQCKEIIESHYISSN